MPGLSDDVPDATDEEHRTWLAAERGVEVSRATVNRTRLRLELTRKKSSAPASSSATT